MVWKYIHNGENLNGAHNSLVDAMAQSDIVLHEYFVPYINRTKSVQKISDMFRKKDVLEWKKKMEPLREVHQP